MKGTLKSQVVWDCNPNMGIS